MANFSSFSPLMAMAIITSSLIHLARELTFVAMVGGGVHHMSPRHAPICCLLPNFISICKSSLIHFAKAHAHNIFQLGGWGWWGQHLTPQTSIWLKKWVQSPPPRRTGGTISLTISIIIENKPVRPAKEYYITRSSSVCIYTVTP